LQVLKTKEGGGLKAYFIGKGQDPQGDERDLPFLRRKPILVESLEKELKGGLMERFPDARIPPQGAPVVVLYFRSTPDLVRGEEGADRLLARKRPG